MAGLCFHRVYVCGSREYRNLSATFTEIQRKKNSETGGHDTLGRMGRRELEPESLFKSLLGHEAEAVAQVSLASGLPVQLNWHHLSHPWRVLPTVMRQILNFLSMPFLCQYWKGQHTVSNVSLKEANVQKPQ